MRRFALYLFILMVFSTSGAYLYYRGSLDGIQTYKQSKNMELTLESAYRYGFLDGLKAKCK